jgi:hypothetical protein
MTFALLYWFTLAAAALFVGLTGDQDEKVAVTLYGVASIVTAEVVSPLAVRFRGLEWSVMIVDGVVLLAFLMIVLRSARIWPLWMTAMQVVSLVTNSVVLSPASRHAYAATLYLLSFGVLGAIVIGSYRSWKQRFDGPFEVVRRDE